MNPGWAGPEIAIDTDSDLWHSWLLFRPWVRFFDDEGVHESYVGGLSAQLAVYKEFFHGLAQFLLYM